MKKYLWVIAAVLVIALAVVALTGCGAPASSGAPESETPAESAAASEEPAASEAASEAPAASDAAGDIAATGETPNVDRIKEAGKIVMLTNAAFPPYEYLGDDNEPVGVDIEIGQAIADELGVELEVVDMDFDGIIGAIQAGKGDFAAAGMTINEERLQNVDFSIEYATSSQYGRWCWRITRRFRGRRIWPVRPSACRRAPRASSMQRMRRRQRSASLRPRWMLLWR